MNTTSVSSIRRGVVVGRLAVALLVLAMASMLPGLRTAGYAEPTNAVSYQGKWKWLTGKFKDRDPGSVTGVIVQHEPTLYKASR